MSNHNTYDSVETAAQAKTYDWPGGNDTYDGVGDALAAAGAGGVVDPPRFERLDALRRRVRGGRARI